MKKKQLPMYLQNRLTLFYQMKFRGSYFKENEILSLLSEPLQREMLINTNQLFVERMKLFRDVSQSLISSIAANCMKEQFLPHDIVSYCRHSLCATHICLSLPFGVVKIIKAGTTGDCLFLIGSGTVCLKTPSGREVCHLEDGDHFGEIALILKNSKVSSLCVCCLPES